MAKSTEAKKAAPIEQLARSIRTDYRTDMNEALVELIQPFTPAVVKFKALTKPFQKNGKPTSFVAVYIDARMVGERLNHVVGAAGWEDVYRVIDGNPASGLPIECALTVLGVTKRDVGQIAPGKIDDKAWKSAYSDALKRAAVKFGVGLYLYKIPQLTAEVIVGQDGKAKGLTIQAQKELRATYERWLASDLNVFGPALDHGDPLPDLVEPDEEAHQGAPAVTGQSDDATQGSGGGNVSAAPERSQGATLDEDDRAATDDEVSALVDLATKISEQAGAAVLNAIAKHRESHGGVVSGKWLGNQVKNAMRKLSERENAAGPFQPPAGATTSEPSDGDVEQAFAGAEAA